MYVPGENTQHNEHNALQVLTDVFWTRAQMWHDDVTHTVVVIFQTLSKYYEDLLSSESTKIVFRYKYFLPKCNFLTFAI